MLTDHVPTVPLARRAPRRSSLLPETRSRCGCRRAWCHRSWCRAPIRPRTPTGKTIRARLPIPEDAGRSHSPSSVASERTPTEQRVAEVWTSALGHDDALGIDDDFSRLGGNSMKAVRMSSATRRALNVDLKFADVSRQWNLKEVGGCILASAPRAADAKSPPTFRLGGRPTDAPGRHLFASGPNDPRQHSAPRVGSPQRSHFQACSGASVRPAVTSVAHGDAEPTQHVGSRRTRARQAACSAPG